MYTCTYCTCTPVHLYAVMYMIYNRLFSSTCSWYSCWEQCRISSQSSLCHVSNNALHDVNLVLVDFRILFLVLTSSFVALLKIVVFCVDVIVCCAVADCCFLSFLTAHSTTSCGPSSRGRLWVAPTSTPTKSICRRKFDVWTENLIGFANLNRLWNITYLSWIKSYLIDRFRLYHSELSCLNRL